MLGGRGTSSHPFKAGVETSLDAARKSACATLGSAYGPVVQHFQRFCSRALPGKSARAFAPLVSQPGPQSLIRDDAIERRCERVFIQRIEKERSIASHFAERSEIGR